MSDRAAQPVCPKCNYDLSGLPLKNQHYICPECDLWITSDEAFFYPYYIKSVLKPILIASLPPAVLLLVAISPPIFLAWSNARDIYSAAFMLLSPITLIWPLIFAIHFSLKVEQYQGPKRVRGHRTTFFIVWISATATLCCFLIPTWISAFGILMT